MAERESLVSNPELYIIVLQWQRERVESVIQSYTLLYYNGRERESRVSNPELYIIVLQWQRERVESVIQSYTLLYYNGRERESSQ